MRPKHEPGVFMCFLVGFLLEASIKPVKSTSSRVIREKIHLDGITGMLDLFFSPAMFEDRELPFWI